MWRDSVPASFIRVYRTRYRFGRLVDSVNLRSLLEASSQVVAVFRHRRSTPHEWTEFVLTCCDPARRDPGTERFIWDSSAHFRYTRHPYITHEPHEQGVNNGRGRSGSGILSAGPRARPRAVMQLRTRSLVQREEPLSCRRAAADQHVERMSVSASIPAAPTGCSGLSSGCLPFSVHVRPILPVRLSHPDSVDATGMPGLPARQGAACARVVRAGVVDGDCDHHNPRADGGVVLSPWWDVSPMRLYGGRCFLHSSRHSPIWDDECCYLGSELSVQGSMMHLTST